jgi:hypothetical protein
VQEGVHVDGFLGDVAQGSMLEFSGGEVVLDYVENGVSHNAFCC